MPLTAPTEPVAGAEITRAAAAGATRTDTDDWAGDAGDADDEPFAACTAATAVATAGAEMALGSADFVAPAGASTRRSNDGMDAGTKESRRRAVAAGASVLLPALPDLLSTWFMRPGRCARVLVDELVEAEAEESDNPEAEEPDEPVSSADAIGIAATAELTPKATASAPTRPT